MFLLFVSILVLALPVFAEDAEDAGDRIAATGQKFAVGIGPEMNWNSPGKEDNSRDSDSEKIVAAGAVLTFDYNLGTSFALGLNVTASSNFSHITVIEPAAMCRWYFLGSDHTGWFVQADIGAHLIFEDDGEVTPSFLGGFRGGVRIPLGDKFFIEPFGRAGYPFALGFGAIAGLRF